MLLLLNAMDAIMPNDATAYREYLYMMQSWFVLISHLMSHSAHSIVTNNNIECLIKIFLGTCHKFDSTFGLNDKSNPLWYRESNFVSLLNPKDQIEYYGPVYLYWEVFVKVTYSISNQF